MFQILILPSLPGWEILLFENFLELPPCNLSSTLLLWLGPLSSVHLPWFDFILLSPLDRHLSQTGRLVVRMGLPVHFRPQALQPSGRVSPGPALSRTLVLMTWWLPCSAGESRQVIWRPSSYTLCGTILEWVQGTYLNLDFDLKEETQILAESISLIWKTGWIMKLFLYEKPDTDEVSQRKHMVDWMAVPISSLFPLPWPCRAGNGEDALPLHRHWAWFALLWPKEC